MRSLLTVLYHHLVSRHELYICTYIHYTYLYMNTVYMYLDVASSPAMKCIYFCISICIYILHIHT